MRRRTPDDFVRETADLRARQSTPGDEERKERVKEHGRECLRRVKGDTTWEDWMGIGAAFMAITEEALEAVSATVWDGNNKRLVKEFNQRWDEYETSAYEQGSNQKPLSKQERWALREVMTKPEIGAWRTTLDGFNRRKLNHPNKVIESWKRATQTSDREPRRPSPSMSQALKSKNQVIEQLEARNRESTEELEQGRDRQRERDKQQAREQTAGFGEKDNRPRPKPSAKPGKLVWTDRNKDSAAEYHAFEAPAAIGKYCLNPSFNFPGMSFGGYEVEQRLGRLIHRISNRVKTLEKAKTIAQSDHDHGRDNVSLSGEEQPQEARSKKR